MVLDKLFIFQPIPWNKESGKKEAAVFALRRGVML
jgi:hypothetical protein